MGIVQRTQHFCFQISRRQPGPILFGESDRLQHLLRCGAFHFAAAVRQHFFHVI